MRILVAEDDAFWPTACRAPCASRATGRLVKTGVEADSALDANDFDLLILDIGLPKKSASKSCAACAGAIRACRC